MTEPLGLSRFWGKRSLGYFSWRRRRRFIHTKKALDLITESVLADDPDLVAITGDLVQLGLASEIEEAKTWLRNLSKKTKVFVVPGNHDIYVKSSVKLVRELWGPYLHLMGNSFPGVIRMGSVIVLGLSSAYPAPVWSAEGRIKSEQLETLRRAMREFENKFVCVLLHHPITADGVAGRKQLKDLEVLQKDFLRLKTNLILHGHLHVNKQYSLGSGLQVFCTASASSMERGSPASYRLIDFNVDRMGVDVSAVLKTLNLDNGELQEKEHMKWRSDLTVMDSGGMSI
tara:strand:+ start:148 stop:1005 length:858 start_codon:yes stop_codon:yes gene_type:complete